MNNKPKTMLLLLFAYTILDITACKHITEQKLQPELTLALVDVTCTEAWIKLIINNLPLPVTITLIKDNVAQNNILCCGVTLL